MPSEHPRRPTLSPCRGGDDSDDYENVGYYMQVHYAPLLSLFFPKNMKILKKHISLVI